MKNELSELMKEITKQILELKEKVASLEERMDIIQGDLGEMAKVSNKTLNESMIKLTEMMNNE